METILDFVADINAEMEAPMIAKMKTFDYRLTFCCVWGEIVLLY